MITADVHATITTYNKSIESHRNDSDYWRHYLNQMGIKPPDPIDVGNVIGSADTYTGPRLGLMVNKLATLHGASYRSSPPTATTFLLTLRQMPCHVTHDEISAKVPGVPHTIPSNLSMGRAMGQHLLIRAKTCSTTTHSPSVLTSQC